MTTSRKPLIGSRARRLSFLSSRPAPPASCAGDGHGLPAGNGYSLPADNGYSLPAGKGYSLIEVLVAAFLLAAVLLSIMGMFVYGGQSVNAGKMMTKATSISNDVLEQFRLLTFKQAYQLIEDGGNPIQQSIYTWNSATGGPDAPSDATYLAMLADWKTQCRALGPNGELTITVRGLGSLGTNPSARPFASGPGADGVLGTSDDTVGATAMQVVVTVRWKERSRARSVVFETLKV